VYGFNHFFFAQIQAAQSVVDPEFGIVFFSQVKGVVKNMITVFRHTGAK
jgi:hypothetical protein